MKKIFFIGFISVLIDFIIKQVVCNTISYNSNINIINKFFYLTYTKNTGGAFSLLSGNLILLIIISFICLSLLIYFLKKRNNYSNLEVIIYGLLIGGIIGNFLDRMLFGGVIDYLGFIIFNYYFPIFNFADICIVVSIFLLFIDYIRGDLNGN